MDILVVNEAILPAQFHDTVRARSGYHRLLLGVIEQAVTDLKHYDRQTHHHCQAILAELRAWFAAEANTPGSFLYICQHLDIDPFLFRRQLQTCSPQSIPRRIFSHSGGYQGLHTDRWTLQNQKRTR